MKKIFLLSVVIATLCACGNTGNNTNDGTSASEDTLAQQEAVAEETTADQSATPVEEDCYILEQFKNRYQPLYASIKVKGTPNVQSFVESLPIYSEEYGWYADPEIDKKNGYFHYFEEGSGHVDYYGAVWNRNDGSKLFIFSFDDCDWNEHEDHTETFNIKIYQNYYYLGACAFRPNEDSPVSFLDYITGCAAYLYNPDTKTLDFLPEPPFNKCPQTTTRRQFILPQHGKDITIIDGFDLEGEELTKHTLKWNGRDFDYVD